MRTWQEWSFALKYETFEDHSPVHNRLSAIRYFVAHAAHVDQLLYKVNQEEAAARHYLGERSNASVEALETLADLKLW